MKVFDFNIHLPCSGKDLDSRLQDETSMTGSSFEKCFLGYESEIRERCMGGNIMLLNSTLDNTEIESLVKTTKSSISMSCLTVMIDPRDINWIKRVKELYEAGVTGIKFHCYIQKITKEDFTICMGIASIAESLGMLVMIDTSYGSLGMYQYDNLRLATAVANVVTKAPIILLHSGGARCLEAMLLADAAKNVFLETSFSLPYYLDSGVERDLAFAYKKLGQDKILYGSDFPYVGFVESEESFLNFMDKWGFTASEIDSIAVQNGLRITQLHV